MIDLTFQYIKSLASPGVWRRGYDYYQKNQVEKVELVEEGIRGAVKGNFRDEYKTLLRFSEEAVTADCDCPFPDEWCKHAVAVALIGISQGLWQKYWGIEDQYNEEEEENVEYQGNYKVLFNEKSRPKTVSIKVIERKTGKPVTQLEQILRGVIEAQKQNAIELNEKEKVELYLLTLLHRHGQFDKNRQHYYILYRQFDELIPCLANLEEVRHAVNNKKIRVETNPLRLILNVNLSMVGNVLVALHWKRTNPDDIIPYEEIRLFAKKIQWGLYKNVFFPIQTTVGELPYFLSKSSFLDIRGGDGGKFIFEQLPKFKAELQGEMEIEESELIQNARLEKKAPKETLVIEKPDENTLRVAIEFDYDGVRVPYSDSSKESPYVCVVKGAPPPKQYSIEEFREQEAAKRKAGIEAGIIDPSKEERKKVKVIRVKVLDKNKIGVKGKRIHPKQANQKDKQKDIVLQNEKQIPAEAEVTTPLEQEPIVKLNEDDFEDYFEVLDSGDEATIVSELPEEAIIVEEAPEISQDLEPFKLDENSKKEIPEKTKAQPPEPPKKTTKTTETDFMDSFVDSLVGPVTPVNILSQDMVKKKDTSKQKKHSVMEEMDLVDKLFLDQEKKVSKSQNLSESLEKDVASSEVDKEPEVAEKPKRKRGRPPKKAKKDADSIEETIQSGEEEHKEPEVQQVNVGEPKDVYWIKRDLELERRTYKRLLEYKLIPMQTNKLEARGDLVIDFVGNYLNDLIEEWQVEYPEEITRIRISPHPFRFKIYIDFDEDDQDTFLLTVACAIGNKELDLDLVEEQMKEGRKYVYAPGEGYAEIPLAEMLQLTKTLNSFDANKLSESKYRVQTFKVGLIGELIDQNVELIMSQSFQKFWDLISSFSTFEEMEIPESIKATLREYQRKGYSWLYFMYTYGLNGILADDMGLGKTLQTLVLLQKIKEDQGSRPNLIICPTSVVYNWEDEIKKFTPELKAINYTGSGRSALLSKINSNDVIVTSYAILRRDFNSLKKYNFRYIVLDEAQKIKNYQSLTASVSKQLRSDHRLALSGTPIENRLSELWSIFDFLMPGFLYDFNDFKVKYAQPIEEYNNKDAERRLKKQVFPFILRRLKQNVAKDLPDKLEFVSYSELLPEQQDIYLDILDQTREEIFRKIERDGIAKSQMSILSALLRLRQICCHPKLIGDVHAAKIRNSGKLENLKEMVKEVIQQGHRILLFSQFVEMLKIIREWLEEEGIKFEYLTGSTKDRKECVDRFNNNDSIPIFLISLKAGGTGLNLTGADYVIHYDPWWNPAVEDQATDRAHRIGQTKKVFVYRLITKGTVEEKMVKLQEKKRDLIDNVITVDTSLGKILTYEDIKEIFTPDF
jgi:SNF2 family DNA or RNA helicase